MGFKRTLMDNNSGYRAHSRGFSLLEVMLVMVVVVTALFPLIQTIAKGLLAGEEMKGSNTAVMVAQKKIEELKNGSFTLISSESLTSVEGFPAYKRSVIVTTPATDLKNINVTVLWNVGGSTIYATYETMVSNFN
jgi:prepilin-type N-terminal cleavage/methylation domain-containing protein